MGGFGITNYGSGVSTIGKVGDTEITTGQYRSALQQELAAFGAQIGQNVTLTQARELGLDRRVQQQLISAAAMANEADRIGLSVGDGRVAQEIRDNPAFHGTAGGFDREAYRFLLERNQLKEGDYEASLRSDLSRALLQGAVSGGFPSPAALTDTLYNYIAERRGLTILRLTEADLPSPLPDASDEVLKEHYDSNIAEFTAPEARRITYAALLPDTLAGTMPLDDEALKQVYQERIDEFVQPERRLVERLVYPSEADADAAKAKLDAGATFESLVAERNLTLSDIDLGDVAKGDLGAAGDAVFALTGPGVVGPFASDLGPALFRMNGILAAQEVPFDEARDQIAAEYQQDAARRAIGDKVEAMDDALAGGATLENLAKEFGMTVETIDFSTKSDELIAGYPAFRDAAAALQDGDFPEAILLDDGGVVTMRLDAIVPPTPIPFDQVREAVTESWHASALAKALAERAAQIKTEVDAGASLSVYGILSVTPEIARSGFIENTPPALLEQVFKMNAGDTAVVQDKDFVGVVRLDKIAEAPATGDAATALKSSINAQVEQAFSQDALQLFGAAMEQSAGITLNQAVIEAVHAQFP